MMNAGKVIDNSALAALTQRAGPQVTAAIQKASLKTGVDFTYMMEKAAAESSFDTDAKAKTSSARGLYQFIESTWLQMVDRYGEKYGLEDYADKISANGKVADPALRREILALRDDPEIASLMAGEFAAENKRSMINAGIPADKIGSTELYLAHFLGAGAASEFIKAKEDNPLAPAADIFPRAAKANRNVFYNSKTQEARSLGEIYAFFDKKFIDTPSSPTATDTTAIATNEKSRSARNSIMAATRSPIDEERTARLNRVNPDLMAMISPETNANPMDMYFGQRLSEAGSLNSILGNSRSGTKNLVTDPVALMLMSNMDARTTAATAQTYDAQDRTANQRKTRISDALNIRQ